MDEQAEESKQVLKARAKLKKQLSEERSKITPDALKKVSAGIKAWINRHAADRVNLKEKNIALFDENQNVAKTTSTFVKQLRTQLTEPATEGATDQQGEEAPAAPFDTLKGRVTLGPSVSEEDSPPRYTAEPEADEGQSPLPPYESEEQ